MKFIKKNKLLVILSVAVFAISSIGIAAYLSASDLMENNVTIGGVNVSIEEDFDPPGKLEPGTEFKKEVAVRNEGPSDAYVRIKAVFTDSRMGDNCTVDWNTTDFVYNADDGYYYYKEPLEVHSATPLLFSTVKVSESMDPSKIREFDILVYAEAYQSEGFADYNEAWNHFKRNL